MKVNSDLDVHGPYPVPFRREESGTQGVALRATAPLHEAGRGM